MPRLLKPSGIALCQNSKMKEEKFSPHRDLNYGPLEPMSYADPYGTKNGKLIDTTILLHLLKIVSCQGLTQLEGKVL